MKTKMKCEACGQKRVLNINGHCKRCAGWAKKDHGGPAFVPDGGFVPQTNDPVLKTGGAVCPYCKKGDQVFASGMFGKKDLSCTRCKRTFVKQKETKMKKTTKPVSEKAMRVVFAKAVNKVKKNLADSRKMLVQDIKDAAELKAEVAEWKRLRGLAKTSEIRRRLAEILDDAVDDYRTGREDVDFTKQEVADYEKELKQLIG